MSPAHQITMLKFIKNLSMLSTTLDSLQNSNAIDVLTDLLNSSIKEPHFREMSNQILSTIYNLCRLSKPRQEDAALNGIIPLLLKITKTERPLKEFAYPILCDMAHSGKVGRRELWRNKGLAFYISLLSDPYWQVTALDAIFIWLQEETYRVEQHLLDGSFTSAIIKCFTVSKAIAFENLLEPLQKLLRLSPLVASSLARQDLCSRIMQKIHHNKAAIRLNLLRIFRSICDASDQQGGLLIQFGLLDAIAELEKSDPAVLVRNMASELIKSAEDSEGSAFASRKRHARRASITASSPVQSMPSYSISTPTTPKASRTSIQSMAYFDLGSSTPRHQRNGTASSIISNSSNRPISRDGSGMLASGGSVSISSSRDSSVEPGSGPGSAAGVGKSRLPRTTSTRPQTRPQLGGVGGKGDANSPAGVSMSRPPAGSAAAYNARRRRQTSGGEGRWS